MTKPRVGRPRREPAAAAHVVTRRVRRLIDLAHGGNVHEASKVSGLAYATIRDLYSGRSTNPSLRTLETLASKYGVFPGWFTDNTQSEAVPAGGWSSYLPSLDGDRTREKWREIIIPFSAWPLPSVYERLCGFLESMPPSESRPIIGTSTNEKEVSMLVTEHLLAPILDAEEIAGNELIISRYMPAIATPDQLEQWISRLRQLGILWEGILSEILPSTN